MKTMQDLTRTYIKKFLVIKDYGMVEKQTINGMRIYHSVLTRCPSCGREYETRAFSLKNVKACKECYRGNLAERMKSLREARIYLSEMGYDSFVEWYLGKAKMEQLKIFDIDTIGKLFHTSEIGATTIMNEIDNKLKDIWEAPCGKAIIDIAGRGKDCLHCGQYDNCLAYTALHNWKGWAIR